MLVGMSSFHANDNFNLTHELNGTLLETLADPEHAFTEAELQPATASPPSSPGPT